MVEACSPAPAAAPAANSAVARACRCTSAAPREEADGSLNDARPRHCFGICTFSSGTKKIVSKSKSICFSSIAADKRMPFTPSQTFLEENTYSHALVASSAYRAVDISTILIFAIGQTRRLELQHRKKEERLLAAQKAKLALRR